MVRRIIRFFLKVKGSLDITVIRFRLHTSRPLWASLCMYMDYVVIAAFVLGETWTGAFGSSFPEVCEKPVRLQPSSATSSDTAMGGSIAASTHNTRGVACGWFVNLVTG